MTIFVKPKDYDGSSPVTHISKRLNRKQSSNEQLHKKGRDLTQSYDISPYTSRIIKRAK